MLLISLKLLNNIVSGTHPGTVLDVTLLPPPPDGGYGWVVVLAAFLHSFFIDGIANSFSVFLPIFRSHFHSSVALTSFIGSALIGCYHLVGKTNRNQRFL